MGSVLETFFLAMTVYPDVQARVHKELDEVVGKGSLPDFSDELPYTQAVVKELLRWAPSVPLGEQPNSISPARCSDEGLSPALPHRLIRDDVYEGYMLPGGSILFGNVWYVTSFPFRPSSCSLSP